MAIRAAIADAFPELTSKAPPIDVHALAARRGVVAISKGPLECDGVISSTASGALSIEVNERHPKVRQRFTIAHEIGHTFFFDLDRADRHEIGSCDADADGSMRSSAEEQLCNFAAAEILMPHRQFAAIARAKGPSANGLRDLARTFDVSLQAAARRLAETLSLNITVALWEHDASTSTYNTSWLLRVPSGRRSAKRGLRIKKNEPGFDTLHRKDQYRGRVWVSLGTQLDNYFVDAAAFQQRGSRFVLTVFVLEKNPSLLFNSPRSDRATAEQLRFADR